MQCTAQTKEVYGIFCYSFQSVLMLLKDKCRCYVFTFFAFLLSLRVDLLPTWFLSGDERDSFTQNDFPNLFIAFQTEKKQTMKLSI